MNNIRKMFFAIVKPVINKIFKSVLSCLFADIAWGRFVTETPDHTIIFFPCHHNLFFCGLSGIVHFKPKKRWDAKAEDNLDLKQFETMVEKFERNGFETCTENPLPFDRHYLGGEETTGAALEIVRSFKSNRCYYLIFMQKDTQKQITRLIERLHAVIKRETKVFNEKIGRIELKESDIISHRLESLKDIAWSLNHELVGNIEKIRSLYKDPTRSPNITSVSILKNINTVLNSIDRLEVRGRDSAGISLLFFFNPESYIKCRQALASRTGLNGKNLVQQMETRISSSILMNNGISLNEEVIKNGEKHIAVVFTYKIAAEIGSLGDNVRYLRRQIKNDSILQALIRIDYQYHTVSSHTRWASVGAITEANCHPVDAHKENCRSGDNGIIHVCLNGDIDNHLNLKRKLNDAGILFDNDITTDTKIIPLQIGIYLNQGHEIEEAFRLAVNDFEGSHAISMHTDRAPGKLFLAQKGSGQSLFIGLAEDHYLPASEVYGFVENTHRFLKIDGEKRVPGKSGMTQGQIFILNQETDQNLDGIKAMFYDGTPIVLGKEDIRHTDITSRDIDRQVFPHYFLKEISEAPLSVKKTLQNRWKIKDIKVRNRQTTGQVLEKERQIGSRFCPYGCRKPVLNLFPGEFFIKGGYLFFEGFVQDGFVNIKTAAGVFVDCFLDIIPEIVKETGSVIYSESGIVSPKMADQGIQNRGQVLADGRYMKNVSGIRVKPVFTVIGNDDRGCLMGFKNGRILNNVTNHGTSRSGRANNNQRF